MLNENEKFDFFPAYQFRMLFVVFFQFEMLQMILVSIRSGLWSGHFSTWILFLSFLYEVMLL